MPLLGLRGAFGRLRTNLAIRRLIRGCRGGPISALPDGRVVVRGRVGGEARPVPMLDHPVLAWRLALRHHNPPGEPIVLDLRDCWEMEIEDETGRARVAPDPGLLFSLAPRVVHEPTYCGTSPLPGELKDLARRHDAGISAAGTYSWRIWFVNVGDPLAVFGHGRRRAEVGGTGGGFRETPWVFNVGPGQGGVLLVTDARDAPMRGRLWMDRDLWGMTGLPHHQPAL